MSGTVRILAYAWNHEGLGHVARLLNVIEAVKELRPDAEVSIVAEQDSDLLRQAGHTFVPVPTHQDSYLGTVIDVLAVERPLERAVAGAVIDAAVRVARPTVVLHDTVVSADLVRAAPAATTPHVLITRRGKPAASYFESLEPAIRELAMVIIGEDPGEVPLADIPEPTRSRLVFSGPIIRPVTGYDPEQVRSRYRVPEGSRMVAVTGGGGGFAGQHSFFEAVAHAIVRAVDRPAVGVIVLGYFFDGIVDLPAAPGLTWRVTRHDADLPALMGSADVVVAQGGYNTLLEAMSVGARVVAVPATRLTDDQAGRARQMTREHDSIVVVDGPDTDAIAVAIASLISRSRPQATAGHPTGRERAARAIVDLAEGRRT